MDGVKQTNKEGNQFFFSNFADESATLHTAVPP